MEHIFVCQPCLKVVPAWKILRHHDMGHDVQEQKLRKNSQYVKFYDGSTGRIIRIGGKVLCVRDAGGIRRDKRSTSELVNQSGTMNQNCNVSGGKPTIIRFPERKIAVRSTAENINQQRTTANAAPCIPPKQGLELSVRYKSTAEILEKIYPIRKAIIKNAKNIKTKRGVGKSADVGTNKANPKRQVPIIPPLLHFINDNIYPPIYNRSLLMLPPTVPQGSKEVSRSQQPSIPWFQPQQRTVSPIQHQQLNNDNNQCVQFTTRSNMIIKGNIHDVGAFGETKKRMNTKSVKMPIKRGILNQDLHFGRKTKVPSFSMNISHGSPVNIPYRALGVLGQEQKQALCYRNITEIFSEIKTKLGFMSTNCIENEVGNNTSAGDPANFLNLRMTTCSPMMAQSATGGPNLPQSSSGKAVPSLIPLIERNGEEIHRSIASECTSVRRACTQQQTPDMVTLEVVEVEVEQTEVKIEVKQEQEGQEKLYGELETFHDTTVKSQPASHPPPKSEELGEGGDALPPKKDYKPNNRFLSMPPIKYKLAPGPPKKRFAMKVDPDKSSLTNGTNGESPVVAVITSTATHEEEKVTVPNDHNNPANPLNPLHVSTDKGKERQSSPNGKCKKYTLGSSVSLTTKKPINVISRSAPAREGRVCKKSTVDATSAKPNPPRKQAKGEKERQKVTLSEFVSYVPKMPGTNYRMPHKSVRGFYLNRRGKKVWRCPVCKKREPENSNKAMIACDQHQCEDWYHLDCVGIREKMPKKDPWYCLRCIRNSTTDPKVDFPNLSFHKRVNV